MTFLKNTCADCWNYPCTCGRHNYDGLKSPKPKKDPEIVKSYKTIREANKASREERHKIWKRDGLI